MLGKSHKMLGGLLLSGGLVAGGCATTELGALRGELREKQEEVETLQTSLSSSEAQSASLKSSLQSKEAKVASLERILGQRQSELDQETQSARKARMEAEEARRMAGARGTELLPPNAKPGGCYARVFIPPTYRTDTETVLVREASERIEVIPAKYEWVEETIQIKSPSERLEVVPATYRWVEEQVLTQPASKRVEVVPPVYETITERVLDRPAHKVWKKGRGPIEKIDLATGEIMCLVDVPASYKTVSKRVLKQPATTRTVEIPAKFSKVRKRVMATPPMTRKVEIPAEYKTVRVRKMVSPAQEKRIPIRAQYNDVRRQFMVTEGKMEWRSILCETNVTADIVTRIQQALLDKGHNPGPIDGVLGSQTLGAVQSFQKDKGLPQGNLTMDTLKQLGVKVGEAL